MAALTTPRTEQTVIVSWMGCNHFGVLVIWGKSIVVSWWFTMLKGYGMVLYKKETQNLRLFYGKAG